MPARSIEQERRMAKKGWVTPTEVASRTGMHPNTVYYWIKRHKIQECRVGGRRYIKLFKLFQALPDVKQVWEKLDDVAAKKPD